MNRHFFVPTKVKSMYSCLKKLCLKIFLCYICCMFYFQVWWTDLSKNWNFKDTVASKCLVCTLITQPAGMTFLSNLISGSIFSSCLSRPQPIKLARFTCISGFRFGRLSPDFVAQEIVKGIRQECEIISIPRFMLFWIHFMKWEPNFVIAVLFA